MGRLYNKSRQEAITKELMDNYGRRRSPEITVTQCLSLPRRMDFHMATTAVCIEEHEWIMTTQALLRRMVLMKRVLGSRICRGGANE